MKTKSKTPRGHSHPIRFDERERKQLQELAEGMSVSMAEVVRMAVRFAAPKFLSGKVSIKDLADSKAA
jgi:hypothetical protein